VAHTAEGCAIGPGNAAPLKTPGARCHEGGAMGSERKKSPRLEVDES